MQEYKFGNAIVRIHGTVDLENLKAATERFMKRALIEKKKAQTTKG